MLKSESARFRKRHRCVGVNCQYERSGHTAVTGEYFWNLGIASNAWDGSFSAMMEERQGMK